MSRYSYNILMEKCAAKLGENLAQLTDSELYKRAQEYGLRAKQWLRKFEGLLPEIARRKLYKRRGFASIHEFAAKLGGMSHEKTDRILRLAAKLENKPVLKSLFESGAAPYSKLEKVAFVATPETDNAWALKVMTIPQQALVLCVEAARNDRSEVIACDNFQPEKNTSPAEISKSLSEKAGSKQSFNEHYAKSGFEVSNIFSFKINPDLEFKLRLIKQQLEKQRGLTLGFAEVIAELIKVYERVQIKSGNSQQKPQKIIQLCPKCIKEKANEVAHYGFTTRYIPQEIHDLVIARQNGKCAFPACNSPPEIFHHTRRFALNQNHDPDYIVHLCAPHERLAHAGLIENEEKASCKWQKLRIDEKVNAHRREPCLAEGP